MLALTGEEHFYFIPGCTDMRYGYRKLSEIVRHKFLREINDKLTVSLRTQKESAEIQKRLEKVIADLQMQLAQEKAKNSTLTYDNETLKSLLELKQKQQFDTKSHNRRKTNRKKNEDEGDDFDCNTNTPSPATGGSETAQPETSAQTQSEEEKSCYHGPSRLGVTYNKEISEVAISHKSDLTKLPEGAVIIGKPREYRIRHAVLRIEEHVYEMITYRTPDGQIHEDYFPMEGGRRYGVDQSGHARDTRNARPSELQHLPALPACHTGLS